MSATDELRRLLDEYGVKWEDYSDEKCKHTNWNNWSCWFTEYPDGWTGYGMSKRGTPEQAIAATLWRTTTRNTTRTVYGNKRPVCEVCGYGIGDKRWSYCPKCGAWIVEV